MQALLWTDIFERKGAATAFSEFSNSRKVLNGKAIVLQENGKGKRPRKADALTENEEELL